MTTDSRLPAPIVDFHVHLFPDKMFEAIWEYFSKGYGWDVLYQYYYRETIRFLRDNGVGPIVYSNYAHRTGVARGLNEWNREVLGEYDDLFCFAAFHPEDDDALDYAKAIIDHPRVLGFKLQLLVMPYYPCDERFFRLYDLVMEKEKRILFHVGNGPVGNDFVGVENFKRLMETYPDIPGNIAHMGALEYGAFFELLDDHPSLYMDTSFVFTPDLPNGCDIPPEKLAEKQDRILYGSDFPNLIFRRESEIEKLLSFNLSDEFYRKVFRDNGLGLLEKKS